jgi:flagellar FliJ protein
MKKFRFPLQALLEVKSRKEDEKKRELAQVNARLLEEQNELQEIENQWNRLQEEERMRRQKGSSAEAMGRAVQYRIYLEQKGIAQDGVIRNVLAAREEKRQELVKASQEKKALENIRDRRQETWKQDYNRQQTKVLDDLCQIQFVRKQAGF